MQPPKVNTLSRMDTDITELQGTGGWRLCLLVGASVRHFSRVRPPTTQTREERGATGEHSLEAAAPGTSKASSQPGRVAGRAQLDQLREGDTMGNGRGSSHRHHQCHHSTTNSHHFLSAPPIQHHHHHRHHQPQCSSPN